MTNWLEFIPMTTPPNRKTSIFKVRNQVNGSHAGMIYWYGGFRKYVFEPSSESFFDANCLREISAFLDELMNEWKQNQKIKKQTQ